jgi:CRISPR-associated protein (TIGR03985 family)
MIDKFQKLSKELLTPEGVSLLYKSGINRIQDVETALRRVAIILFTYHPDIGKISNDGAYAHLGFPLGKWFEKIEDYFEKRGYNYHELTSIEILDLLGICTGMPKDLLSTIAGIYTAYGFNSEKTEKSLRSRPFDITKRQLASLRKNVDADFKFLAQVNPSWFVMNERENTNYFQYQELANLPIVDTIAKIAQDIFDPYRKKILAEHLDTLIPMEPDLSEIADEISSGGNPDSRVYIYFGNVIHDDHDSANIVEENHRKLREFWSQTTDPLVSFKYDSASLGEELECLVCPVRIYYYKRAKYLSAWGYKSGRGIAWYNYRLDRIQPNSLAEVPWDSEDVPDELLQTKTEKNLTPSYIQEQMDAVWGFSFYETAATLILRFDRQYHDKHIANTFRHQTFQPMFNITAVKQLLSKEVTDPLLLKELNARINLHPDDAYYQAKIRLNDNEIIMRLRAWGDKVEVLSPNVIRQRMITDLQNTLDAYQK